MSPISPTRQALAFAILRRLRSAAMVFAARAICCANMVLAVACAMGGGAFLMGVAMSPLLPGPKGAEPAFGSEWSAPAALAAIVAWAAWDAYRNRQFFVGNGLSWTRPARSLTLIVCSPFYINFNRMVQLNGMAPLFNAPAPAPIPNFWPDFAPSATWSGCFAWLRQAAEPWPALARVALALPFWIAAFTLGCAAAMAMVPFAMLEEGAVALWSRAKQFASVPLSERARRLESALVAEGQDELAKAEAAAMARSASSAPPADQPGPRL